MHVSQGIFFLFNKIFHAVLFFFFFVFLGPNRNTRAREVPARVLPELRPREKTGREFAEDLLNRQNRMRNIRDLDLGFYNPVNKDHRRLFDDKPEEPEWVHNGPSSRFDTVELKGFDDHEDFNKNCSSPTKKPEANLHEKRQPQGTNPNQPFHFDEFFGASERGFGRPTVGRSRFKQMFKRDNTIPAPHHHAPGGTNLFDTVPQHPGNLLLNLLHGQGKWPEQQRMSEHDQQSLFMNQLNQNRQYLAGKAMLEVLSAVTQTQQQQQQQRQMAPPSPQNEQVMRMFELHRQIQAANPSLNYQGNSPKFWEDIQQRQRAYYQQYAQQHQNQGPQRRSHQPQFVGASAMNAKKNRHVHFSPQTHEERIAQFFKPEVVAQATHSRPQFDPEKAMKVEEFERKIKEAAASCKRK